MVLRFAMHIGSRVLAVFGLSFDPRLDATNWRAEHAWLPSVMTSKVCGGDHRLLHGV
jgi:hypothetical protein